MHCHYYTVSIMLVESIFYDVYGISYVVGGYAPGYHR